MDDWYCSCDACEGLLVPGEPEADEIEQWERHMEAPTRDQLDEYYDDLWNDKYAPGGSSEWG